MMKETVKKTKVSKAKAKTAKTVITADQKGAIKLIELIGGEPVTDRAWVFAAIGKTQMIEVKNGSGRATLYPFLRVLYDFNPKSLRWVFRGFSEAAIAERALTRGCKVNADGTLEVVDPEACRKRRKKNPQTVATSLPQESDEVKALKDQVSDLTSIVQQLMSKLGGGA